MDPLRKQDKKNAFFANLNLQGSTFPAISIKKKREEILLYQVEPNFYLYYNINSIGFQADSMFFVKKTQNFIKSPAYTFIYFKYFKERKKL